MKYQIEISYLAYIDPSLNIDKFIEHEGPVMIPDPDSEDGGLMAKANEETSLRDLYEFHNPPGGKVRYFFRNKDPTEVPAGRYDTTEEFAESVKDIVSRPLLTVGLQRVTDHLEPNQMLAEAAQIQSVVDAESSEEFQVNLHRVYMMPGLADKAWQCIGRWPIPEEEI